jgi:hypothetical protein
LISGAPEPAVCLHYETQQTHNKQCNVRKNTQTRNIHKKITIMKASKLTIALFTLITLTVGFSTVTMASEEPKKSATTELKFIGNLNNSPVFELSLVNPTEDEIVVTFRDDAGNVVYVNTFKGSAINKKFLLKSDGFENTGLNVTVKSVKNNSTEVYAINTNLTYVEETVVNKLK